MNRRSVIWGSLGLVSMVYGAAVQAATAGTDEQAVASAEHQWLKAQQTNNVELLAPLLSDRVVDTQEDKLFMGKGSVLAESKSEIWSSAEYTDLKVTVFGHTAIATGWFIGKGMSAGKPLNIRTRFTDTWVKMAKGKWLCVATHS